MKKERLEERFLQRYRMPAFRQSWQKKCDKNGDGILSDSERSSITRMMLPAWQEDVLGEGTPIVSLEGIQYFYNLQISIAQTLG